MKKMWALCLFEIQRLLKQKRTLVLMFAMPLIFTFLFGGLSSDEAGQIALAIVDNDHSPVTAGVIKCLQQSDALKIIVTDSTTAAVQWHDKKIAGIITLPAGLADALGNGETMQTSFQHGPELTTASVVLTAVNNALAQQAVQIAAAKDWSRYKKETNWQPAYDRLTNSSAKPQIQVAAETVTKNKATRKLTDSSQRSIGFTIMFVMMAMLSATGTILQARQAGVWYRLMATPASRLQVMGGYLLSFLLIGWVQFAILISLSAWLFGVQWGSMLGTFVLVSSLLLCVTGLGLFLAGYVRTPEQQGALGTLVIVSTCMLGGVYWSLDIVPPLLQKIGAFTPQYWAMQGFTRLIAQGGGVADIRTPVLILLGAAAVFLTMGLARVRYE